MPQVEFVETSAVAFPDLRRDLYSSTPHTPGVMRFEESDLSQYDWHTVFHDVVLSHDDQLIATGPPLLNLRRELLPVRVHMRDANGDRGPTHDGRLRVWQYRNCTLASATVPDALRGKPLAVTLRFGRDGREVARVLQPAAWPHVGLSLGTMQKDNPPRWVADWIRYHVALGVERVLIYDNNSADLPALMAALEAIDSPVQIVVVGWNHPFGMVRCHANKFAQVSSLNHCHTRFGATDWMLNLDIDEYLVIRHAAAGTRAAADWLARCSPRTGLARFDSCNVVHPRTELLDIVLVDGRARDNYSVCNLTTRLRRPRGRSFKYALRPAARVASAPHRARLRFGWWRRKAALDDALFLHFLTLGTGWKSQSNRPLGHRGRVDAFDPAEHVEDTAVCDVFDILKRSGG